MRLPAWPHLLTAEARAEFSALVRSSGESGRLTKSRPAGKMCVSGAEWHPCRVGQQCDRNKAAVGSCARPDRRRARQALQGHTRRRAQDSTAFSFVRWSRCPIASSESQFVPATLLTSSPPKRNDYSTACSSKLMTSEDSTDAHRSSAHDASHSNHTSLIPRSKNG